MLYGAPYHEVQLSSESMCADPQAHLQDTKLAVLPLETPRGSPAGEAFAVGSQPVHISVKNIAPKLPSGVIH